ncbi:hypothetical protein [Microvirga tunisiensis]|uniref:hypothetical protein n=1 Tax=Microvirga tunisiensis TaxID=2108360 RepID=UPI00129CA14F|nr:hypothetical protein [Microvirga tunisiensis]
MRVTSDSHGCIAAAQQESGASTEAASRPIIADAAQELFEMTLVRKSDRGVVPSQG